MAPGDLLTPSSELLNLGCGRRFHPNWTNVDMVSDHPSVIAYNLQRGIPFADQTFRVVYHSHMLEHLPHDQTQSFLRECLRVLRPGGVIRVAVPDLEEIARLYLQKLELALAGDTRATQEYEWVILEFYDQTVRERPSGAMGDYVRRPDLAIQDFLVERSFDARRFLERAASQERSGQSPAQPLGFGGRLLHYLGLVVRNPRILRERVLRIVLGGEYELLQIGRFRRSGEIHQWMYDRYSLGQLLKASGFTAPSRMGATESLIPGWSTYNLDTEPDGRLYKGDSLFMEAVRP
jgi:SAM-dependent methyltransferase